MLPHNEIRLKQPITSKIDAIKENLTVARGAIL